MKIQFNEKASAVLARQFDLMVHELFVAIRGLSAWKGTAAGIIYATGIWAAFVFIAFAFRSLAEDTEEDKDESEGDDGGAETG